jgi:hypothetical protein
MIDVDVDDKLLIINTIISFVIVIIISLSLACSSNPSPIPIPTNMLISHQQRHRVKEERARLNT